MSHQSRILTFEPLDLHSNRDLILRFRADSFKVSFGSSDLFYGADGEGAQRYLALLEERNKWTGSCVHVLLDHEIVGQIEMRPNDETQTAGYVNLFYLDSPWRDQGLGLQLDAYAQDFFLRHGMRESYLNVSPTNTRAIRFYQKCGWQILRRLFKSGAEIFIMRKKFY